MINTVNRLEQKILLFIQKNFPQVKWSRLLFQKYLLERSNSNLNQTRELSKYKRFEESITQNKKNKF
jgi:hypothetical protein